MNVRVWREYFGYFHGMARGVVLGALLAIVAGVLLLPVPLLIGFAFDKLIPSGRLGPLTALGAGILLLYIIDGAAMIWTRVAILRVTKEATARLQRRAVAKLVAASRSYYDARETADIHDVVVQESQRVDAMSQALLAELAPAVVLSVGMAIVLAWINWMLFLAMLIVLPLNIVAARRMGRLVRREIEQVHRLFARFSGGILHLVRAVDLMRVQTAEDVEAHRQTRHIEHLRDSSRRAAALAASYTVVQQSLIAMAGVVVLVVGGAAAVAGRMTVGSLLSYFAGLLLLRNPLQTMMRNLPIIMDGRQALARLTTFFDEEEREPYQGGRAIPFSGAIALRDVTFGYGTKPVLKDVSLSIVPGETVALIGPNGSGKSTIVNLILGFYRPQQGTVTADGVSFDDLDVRELRRHIGVVRQDPFIVPGTIRDNLLYGLLDPGPNVEEQMRAATREAGVDAFVSRLDRGYDTNIGEDGHLLSGGQRQRVALARALIGGPSLLILDEPMNHLDESDGARFLARLMAMSSAPAVLIISHRDEAVTLADRVYRLDAGRISSGQGGRRVPAAAVP